MLYRDEVIPASRVLNWVSNAWLSITVSFLLIGYVGIFFAADSIGAGMSEFVDVIKRMNASSLVSLAVILGPGVVGKIASKKLAESEARKETTEDA